MKIPSETLQDKIGECIREDDAEALALLKGVNCYKIIEWIISNSFVPKPNVTKMIKESTERFRWTTLEIKKMLKECNAKFISDVLGLLDECLSMTAKELKKLREEGYDLEKIEAYESFYKIKERTQISPQSITVQANRSTIVSVCAFPTGTYLRDCNVNLGSITRLQTGGCYWRFKINYPFPH